MNYINEAVANIFLATTTGAIKVVEVKREVDIPVLFIHEFFI